MPFLSKHPGNEILEQLIIKCEATLSLISDSLLKNQGIKANADEISKWIRQDEKLRKLAKEMRRVRKIRIAEERAIRLDLEYPNKEELKQLIREYKANATQITNFLKKQGKKVRLSETLRVIDQDEELRNLAREIRKVKVTVNYPGPKKEKSASQIKKPAAEEKPEHLSEATTKEKDLPLSEEEIEMLLVYQEGDSREVLINKTKKPGGRVDILITSILARKHVATLSEAKEKSKEELVTA